MGAASLEAAQPASRHQDPRPGCWDLERTRIPGPLGTEKDPQPGDQKGRGGRLYLMSWALPFLRGPWSLCVSRGWPAHCLIVQICSCLEVGQVSVLEAPGGLGEKEASG